MIASSEPLSHVRVFRPKLWRYARFRFFVISGACLSALAVVRLMEALGMKIPHLRVVDLAIVGCVYLLLDVLFALTDRHRVALRLSPAGISAIRPGLGDLSIPWERFDWQASQRRGLLDRLLGQSYICDITGQRFLWHRASLAPADVQAILAEFDRHARGSRG